MTGKSERSQSIVSFKTIIVNDILADVQEEPRPGPSGMDQGVHLRASELNEKHPLGVAPEMITQTPPPEKLSLKRKICVIVSCLPAVLFVLTFAVLLPCLPKYPSCVSKMWSIDLNQTDVTSELKFADNFLFTYERGEMDYGIMSINVTTGQKEWEMNVSSIPKSFMCSYGLCVLQEFNGHIFAFTSNNSEPIWEYYERQPIHLPLILPDCNEDEIPEFASIISKSRIRITFEQRYTYQAEFPNCSSYPSHFLRWPLSDGNRTDLLLICEDGGKDVLMRIPHNRWCDQHNGIHDPVKIIKIADKKYFSKETKFLPTPVGCLVWTKKELFLIGEDDQIRWTTPTFNHSLDNRFLLYGKSFKKAQHVILCSTEGKTLFKVMTLDPRTGKMTEFKKYSELKRVTNVEVLRGEGSDTLLMVEKRFMTINSTNGTFETKFTGEGVKLTTLNGELLEDLIKLGYNGEERKSLIKAFTQGTGGKSKLKVFILRELEGNSTTFESYSLGNWDYSGSESSCGFGKEL